METDIKINRATKLDDYFPCLFSNKDDSIIILADMRTSDRTFSGMIIHSSNKSTKGTIGTYSTGWTYEQFKRLPRGTDITIKIKQEEE